MDRFVELETFLAVADRGGFAPAARRLGVSPPAVTRAVAALERRLGVSLFRRTTRNVALTVEGTAFLERVREVMDRLGEAECEAMGRQSTPHGELHVTAPMVFGRLHVLPVIAGILAQYPELSVRLMLLDRNIRLAEEGIDVAVRIGELPDSNLRSVPIGTVRQVLVASADYCARRGQPDHPRDLARHDLVAGDTVRTGTQWRFGPQARPMTIKPRLTVTSIDAQIAAAEAGLGIINVLSYQAASGVTAGRLQSLMESHAPPPLPINLLFDVSRARLPALRLLIKGMQSRMKTGAWC